MTFKLGDRVVFTHTADNPYVEVDGKTIEQDKEEFDEIIKNAKESSWDWISSSGYVTFIKNQSNDEWTGRREIRACELDKPLEGIIVDRRQICEGIREWDSETGEYGTRLSFWATFKTTKRQKVYIIKTGFGSKEYKVLPEHIQLLD